MEQDIAYTLQNLGGYKVFYYSINKHASYDTALCFLKSMRMFVLPHRETGSRLIVNMGTVSSVPVGEVKELAVQLE